jgi:hypothetical protein
MSTHRRLAAISAADIAGDAPKRVHRPRWKQLEVPRGLLNAAAAHGSSAIDIGDGGFDGIE